MEEIEKLEPEKRKLLEKKLRDNLYDRHWCRVYRIDYSNPDIEKAREKTYQELRGKFFPGNNVTPLE